MAVHPLRPATDRRLGEPLPHQLANQTRDHLSAHKALVSIGCPLDTLCGISSRFQLLSPSERQVAHTLLTRPPLSHTSLRRISVQYASFDLHVLGTPPAFILSQDQTLNKSYLNTALSALLKSILDKAFQLSKEFRSHF